MDTPILLVKSSINEGILRKMFDLIPGLIEFGVYLPGYQFNSCNFLLKINIELKINKYFNSDQYLARYENELIAAYAVEKLNSFELSNGDAIKIEYFNKSKKSEEPQKNANTTEDLIRNLISLNAQNSSNSNGSNLLNDDNIKDLSKNLFIQNDQLQTISSYFLITSLLNQLSDKNQTPINPSQLINNNNKPNNQKTSNVNSSLLDFLFKFD